MSVAGADAREDSVFDDNTPPRHEHDSSDHSQMLGGAMSLHANQILDPPAPIDGPSSVPFPSSIANLSTPRRLAACVDCHNSSSPSHDHGQNSAHTHGHDAAQTAFLYPTPTRSKSSGLSRTRTAALAKLPLERTPNGFALQDLQTTIRESTLDLIVSGTRHMQDVQSMMPLEYGTPVWGVLEAIRAGDIEIYEDDELLPSPEGQEAHDASQIPLSSYTPAMTQTSTQDFSGACGTRPLRVNVDIQAQSAFTAPPVTKTEAQNWEQWVGAWIARTHRTPTEDEAEAEADVGGEEVEEGEQAGLYVVEAVLDCASGAQIGLVTRR